MKRKDKENLPISDFGIQKEMYLIYPKNYTSLSTILCLILIFSQCLSSSSGLQQPTAYEILTLYNFPVGLLPKGVTGYYLDKTTGKFSAFLNGTCIFSLEGSYQIRYKSTVKGLISRGKLSRLEGVSVKLFFMWIDIVEVSRNGDSLDFSVGIASAGFPIDNFEESPQCGCGLKCGDQRKISKFRSNPFVSSS
ncbi:uncharacterized protein LOC110621930 [Manihot esculenta]|uniref:Uncharacterized protein n=2 Tax=Manihot esculenta TaxID=3983 RepID=A0ACB7H8H3_MANES|nr:uncharacterized protein LOC110621930 [Manihot esculenta]KAG8648290.1 hypothetical protein MANES_09G171800v8 [Manihot esculenta]